MSTPVADAEALLDRTASASIYAFAAWILGLVGATAGFGGLAAYVFNVAIGFAEWRPLRGVAALAALPALAGAVAAAVLARKGARHAADALASLREAGDLPEDTALASTRSLRRAVVLTGLTLLMATLPALGALSFDLGPVGPETRSLFVVATSLAAGAVVALPFLHRAGTAARSARGEGRRSLAS